MKAPYHIPILSNEVVNALDINPCGIYVDATFGGGGHARAILSELDEKKGKLIVMDQDKTALEKNLPQDERIVPIYANFRYLNHFLRYYGIQKVNGVFADLGVSSYQFDTASRGFSIMRNGPLDMRMNASQQLTAQYIIQHYSEDQLITLFEEYAQLPNAITAAKTIVEARKGMKIETTQTLSALLSPISIGNKMKYLAQVFQAIRIEVNGEIDNLQLFLDRCAEAIDSGGRIAILSFHSVEDKVVKQAFKHKKDTQDKPVWTPVNEKPIMASDEEVDQNSRSRSARLRIALKK